MRLLAAEAHSTTCNLNFLSFHVKVFGCCCWQYSLVILCFTFLPWTPTQQSERTVSNYLKRITSATNVMFACSDTQEVYHLQFGAWTTVRNLMLHSIKELCLGY